MHKVAVIGANGQVGAELCLLLSNVPDIDLVPVCRNQTGSAFLRYSGIACRHGRAADPTEAPRLFEDCDAIVNCALGTGTPSEIRAFDERLISNLFAFSAEHATIIHCSTLMVHGDPTPGKLLRFRNPYGRAKFAAEKLIRKQSKRFRKPGYTLRLGHVCGPLQNITSKIRNEILAGQVILPQADVPSNTVYTLTIVDAITSILAGKEHPGEYDLTNVPQWTWRQVYEFESSYCGSRLNPQLVAIAKPQSVPLRLLRWTGARMSRFAGARVIRQSLEKCLALAPRNINDRAQASWYKLRARAEINALMGEQTVAPELSWISLDRQRLTSLQQTQTLLAGSASRNLMDGARPRWPRDLIGSSIPPERSLEKCT